MTAEEWVDLIVRRGAELSAVGCRRITADGCSAVIEPSLDARHTTAAGPQESSSGPILDAMDDPATFGGILPGYDIPRRRDDGEADA